MGSEFGYAYDFRLAMVELDEINSRFKSKQRDGVKTFLFEFRTNFILKIRPEDVEGEAGDVIIDSERFDACMFPTDDERLDLAFLSAMAEYRLIEYWMKLDEIRFLLNETLDFTRKIASDPQYASLSPIPVAVCLEVRTVQQEGEALDDALDRAIRAEYLVPLYMWPHASVTIVKFRAMCNIRWSHLRSLSRVRVENVEEGLALMRVCAICSRSCKLGTQISSLPTCGHAFHFHCILRWLEINNFCPSCSSPAFHGFWELL